MICHESFSFDNFRLKKKDNRREGGKRFDVEREKINDWKKSKNNSLMEVLRNTN